MPFIERRLRRPNTKETETAGTAGAITLGLGPYRDSIEIYYNFNASNGDIAVEVSDTGDYGGEEHEHFREASADQTTGSETHIPASTVGETQYEYARVYYEGNDADIDLLEATAK